MSLAAVNMLVRVAEYIDTFVLQPFSFQLSRTRGFMSVEGTSSRHVATLTALTVLPFFISKAAIAANTAFVEYYFGRIGGNTLASEADTLHWEYLWIGTALGGLRAVSVLSAKACNTLCASSPLLADEEDLSLANDPASASSSAALSCPSLIGTLTRGRLPALRVATSECEHPYNNMYLRLGAVNNAAFICTTLYGGVAMCAFYFTSSWFFLAAHTSPDILARAQDYGRGFWWGVLPTLWLGHNEQFALGLNAAGIALIYGGVIYATLATVIGALLYSEHGAYGLGVGMSAGAWIGWALLKLHFFLDDRFRVLGLNFEPLMWLPRVGKLSYFQVHVQATAELLALAVPLAISNSAGLARGLVVTALVTQASTLDARAYSVSGAYYQTLNIAMLGASSCVSAVMSGKDPYASSDEGRVSLRTGRAYFVSSATLVLSLALVLGALPLIAPRQFAATFGGEVYAFGTNSVDPLLSRIKCFTYIMFAEYTVAVVGMVVSATLHGFKDVWVPMLVTLIANALGAGWAVGFETYRPSSHVVLIAVGGVVTQCVYLLFMATWFWKRRRSMFSTPL